MFNKLIIVLITLTTIFSCHLCAALADETKNKSKLPAPHVKRLSPKLVKKIMLTQKTILIDIPSNSPYEKYHICGAINGKRLNFSKDISVRKIPKNYIIIIYCD